MISLLKTMNYQNLEDYKKAVKAYLTKKLGVSEQVATLLRMA